MLCHDPRISNNRDEKIETENPALKSAEIIRQQMGKYAEVDWEAVALSADTCDWPLDKDGPPIPNIGVFD